MLRSLNIRNVVLIDRLDMDFKPGFGVLTGETGAGKSILLDSLGLVLGKRAETSLIRRGEDKLSVTAVFDKVSNPELANLLAENDLDAGDEYTDEDAFIYAYTDKEPHNTITPIARKIVKASFEQKIHQPK